MKKLWAIPLLILIICFCAVACTPAGVGSVDQKGANVFPVSTMDDSLPVAMGDVMPFYDDGVMNIYHLRDSKGTNSIFYHPIARITTTDFIHYTDEGIALDFEEKITSIDAALGTGSFIKGSDGTYHCFYTGHNGMKEKNPDTNEDEFVTGFKHAEVVRHATSTDQKTWVKDEDFNLVGWEDDFRDPYVYYDGVDGCYYMLITTRDSGAAVIKRYFAKSLDANSDDSPENENGWRFKDNFFTNDEGSYNMECPSFIELNGFYYLAYSEQGDNRVTHYRYKTSHDGEWQKFERDSIDASGFYAGRLEKAGDKLYAFAWCARLSGGSSGGFDWGGNLVTHELVQDATTGELSAVMPQNYKQFFSTQVFYKTVDGRNLDEVSFDGTKFAAVGLEKLSTNVTRISLTIDIKGDKGNFGLSFGLDGDYNNRLGSAVIAFDLDGNRLTCYNGVSSILRYGAPLASVAFGFEQSKSYNVDVIIDGEIITVYLNGAVALTSRITDMDESNFAFYSNGAQAKIRDVKFYE